ncbi:MAG: DNA recombination protein RmuC [Chitinivibrionales bacterium]
MQIIIIVMLGCVLAGLLFVALQGFKTSPKREELACLKTLFDQAQKQIEELQVKAKLADELSSRNARLEADLENERKGTQEKLKLLQDSEARMKTEFENLANRIFEEKGKTFTEQNKEKLSSLLSPMREQLESFRKRVDDVHKDDTAGMAKLLEQVRQLQELNNKVSEDANNLARAIKGDSKAQGNWGELIVERIFEASGLECGREYDCQAAMRTEDGRLQKPDFVVNLPGNKAVIVDSKVSLTAYERFCGEQDEKAKQAALAEHLSSIRKHIDELKQKAYQQLLGNRTLDFVIMCVPVEPAYQLAHEHDKDLIYDLAAGNVVVTGPATLMLTLKLIAQIWRRENESRNAEVIADRAGRLYDQVALIIETMLDAQKKLDGVRDSFDIAMKRLKDGRGNLVGRIEEIRKLGAKASKQLSQEVIDKSADQIEENESKNV